LFSFDIHPLLTKHFESKISESEQVAYSQPIILYYTIFLYQTMLLYQAMLSYQTIFLYQTIFSQTIAGRLLQPPAEPPSCPLYLCPRIHSCDVTRENFGQGHFDLLAVNISWTILFQGHPLYVN
jgi:hypothetical protein